MTPKPAHGAASRRQVYSGNRRIPGLYERRRANGSFVYEAAFWYGGRTRRHRLEAQTKTDAIAELRNLRTDYARGEQYRSRAAALTIAELSVDWVAHLESRVGHRDPKRRYSARTVELYRQRLAQHILPSLGARPVADIQLGDVRRLVDRLGAAGLAPSTVTGVIGIFSGLLRFGIKGGHIERNPVRDLDRDDRPGTKRLSEPRYLSPEEIDQLLQQLSNTFRPVIFVCVYAGLRISEALGLRWRDVDLDAGTLTVSGQLGGDGQRVPVKTTASAATVDLLPALIRELREHRARQVSRGANRANPNALVFSTSRGKPQSRRNAFRALRKAGDAAGLNGDEREPVGLHDLRHSFAAAALERLSLTEASYLLRHASARVTAQVYAGLTEDARRRVAAKLAKGGFGR
jgi:integrase